MHGINRKIYGQMFKVWPYFYIPIFKEFTNQDIVNLFSARTSTNFSTSLAKWNMCDSLRLRVRDPNNIFYYQRDVQSYMDQVLSIFHYFINMNIHTESWGLNSGKYIYVTDLYKFFLDSNNFDWQNQSLFSENSFSEELTSYWLLIRYVTSFVKSFFHWK